MTNIVGTANLLNAARNIWENDSQEKLFYHISTDEVLWFASVFRLFYRNLSLRSEKSLFCFKAGSDHIVRAWYHTYKLPVVISNCSNNYGPNQFPEKLIPLAINNIINNKPVPVYGKGDNVRDWLYVEDHAKAIDLLYHRGKVGNTYNIGGNNEWSNISLVKKLCDVIDDKLRRKPGTSSGLITFVKDRAGHDLRYAIDSTKLQKELDWQPENNFESGIVRTVEWYLDNQSWLNNVLTGEYEKYYDNQYNKR